MTDTFITGAELFERVDSEYRKLMRAILDGSQRWGRWRFDYKTFELVHDNGYAIDLDDCESAQACLDWIMHVGSTKVWCTAEDTGNVVRAICKIFRIFHWDFTSLNARKRWAAILKQYEGEKCT